ncbi:MAG: Kiwa anti-phage protein KwaB-like domain-containing protein [Gemmatimonadota bacterium]
MAVGDADGLFALMRGEDVVRRLPLSHEARTEISGILNRAANALSSPELEQIAFDGRCRPDDDEVLTIRNFELPELIRTALGDPLSCEALKLSNHERAPAVRALFTGSPDASRVVFQAFRPNQFLTRSGLSLLFRNDMYSTLETPGLNVRNDVDLVFQNDQVFFRSFQTARSVLDLNNYFREATDDELHAFAATVRFDNPASFERNADTQVRRRVALIRYNGILEAFTPSAIHQAAVDHGIPLRIAHDGENEVLVFPDNKKQLKEVLKFLDEDYYRGPVTGKAYVSNSKSSRS